MELTTLEQQACAVLDPMAYDYFAGGADDELTVEDNLASWSRLRLRPRVLRDTAAVETATTVLGTRISQPVMVAPMAYQRLAHPEGELATARGTAAAETVMIVSIFATTSLEDVAVAAPSAARWFQLYVHRDRAVTAELVARAASAGYRALVVTLDVPVIGRRRRDERNRFALPDGMVMANAPSTATAPDGSVLNAYAAELDASLGPHDIEWLAAASELPVVAKGVLRGDDARTCVEAGAAAVVVSNHGGRQLDTALAGADALPDVVEAVAADAEVYVDGGVRCGTDIVKALALGARSVLVGRPVMWGLATGGATGVTTVLAALREETVRAFTLCGCVHPDDVGPDLLTRRPLPVRPRGV